MQVFNQISENKNLSLAFGFFDGMHLGHQAVIKSAVDYGREYNVKTAIITFQEHPCCYFYDVQPKYLMTKSDKVDFFEKSGVDYLYFLKFDEYLAMMDASEYLKDVIIKNFEPMAITTGFNHYFGAKKSGDVKLLCTMQKEFCYQYFEIPPVLYKEEVISSTRIREDLAIGNIEAVNSMLGYEYFLEGMVLEGQKLGRELGFKTANLVYPEDLVQVGRGVYKVNVEYQGENFAGIANYGFRPTVGEYSKPILEIHILNFEKDIYNEKIRITFSNKIRDEKKFNSLDELKLQIQQDINSVSHNF